MATKTKAKPATKAVVKREPGSGGSVPAYLQNRKTATTTTMRQQDLIVPRVKLLQALSPEIEDFAPHARPGTFWHNIMGQNVGNEDEDYKAFDFICFKSRYFYLLFAPRNDPRIILARANDGIHWSPSSGQFKVKPKGASREVVYTLKPTVEASGLAEFGTAIPGDPESQPAATLIYEYLIYMPDYSDLGPMILSLARSQIKKGKVINSAHQMTGVAMSGLRFRAEIIQEQSAEGPYYNYQFKRAGWATEEEANQAETYAERFAAQGYQAAGGEEGYRSDDEAARGGPKDVPKTAKGF